MVLIPVQRYSEKTGSESRQRPKYRLVSFLQESYTVDIKAVKRRAYFGRYRRNTYQYRYKNEKHDHIFGRSKHFMYLCRQIETKNNE